MAETKKIKVALVRGDSLNEWEGRLWENLGEDISVVGICSKNSLYDTTSILYPVKRLNASTDGRFVNKFFQYFFGQFQRMFGLESNLAAFDIAHTAEISYFYTTQAIRAKRVNPILKVAVTVWDNSFGRFDYNYWPLFKRPPNFWRNKINAIIKENIDGADLFLPVTNYSREMLLHYGADEEKIKILTPAVLLDNKTNDGSEQFILNKIRTRKMFLTVSRLVKEKGIYDILFAWKIFTKQSATDVILVIIGKGPEEKNLKALARELEIEGSIVFVGRLPNQAVRRLYKNATALILASIPTFYWQEQFGYAAAEAIYNECPVITTYSGSLPEVVATAGIIVSPGNPPALAGALLNIIKDSVLENLKTRCVAEKARFDATIFRLNLSALYRDLVSR